MEKKQKDKARQALMHKWNTQVAPHTPSRKRLDRIKRYVKKVSKWRENFIDSQVDEIKVQQEQDQIVRDYISDHKDEPGLAVSEASRQSFNVHRFQ